MLVCSEYPRTTLHPRALACERTSILNSFHHVSRVSGSSKFVIRSRSFTDLELTVPPEKLYKQMLKPVNSDLKTGNIRRKEKRGDGQAPLPMCCTKPGGNLETVRKGYSNISKLSWFITGGWRSSVGGRT